MVTTTENEGEFVLTLALGIGLLAGLIFLITRKQLIDFEQCYQPLSKGSKKRKTVFLLSVFLDGVGRIALL